MIDKNILARASECWGEACRRLGVRIVAPYILEVGQEKLTCIGFLPNFGKSKGMIIAAMDLPSVKPNRRLAHLAGEFGLFCSHVNATPFATGKIEERVFTEALEDWGYFGPANECPSWFNGHKHFLDPK
jgi:hypothetical protein